MKQILALMIAGVFAVSGTAFAASHGGAKMDDKKDAMKKDEKKDAMKKDEKKDAMKKDEKK